MTELWAKNAYTYIGTRIILYYNSNLKQKSTTPPFSDHFILFKLAFLSEIQKFVSCSMMTSSYTIQETCAIFVASGLLNTLIKVY